MVMVTHNLGQAKRISDYLIVMSEGLILEEGGSEEIFQNPQNKLTEDYFSGRFA